MRFILMPFRKFFSIGLSRFAANIPVLNISYKPQKISPKSQGTVQQLLHEKIRDAYIHPQVTCSQSLEPA